MPHRLDLRKIARSQGKLARVGSGLAEGEVPVGTSREDRPLPAEVIWPGDGGVLRKSSRLQEKLRLTKRVKGPRNLPRVWIFPLILFFCLLLATSLRLHGSSIGMFERLLNGPDNRDTHLILNQPRPIRSDEWELNTPLTIAQAKLGFPRINKNIGDGQDMSVIVDVPYKEWSALFKPQHWAFFVMPAEYAFAFKWWLLGVLLMISCYLFTLEFLPKKYLLASLLAVSIFLSPFVQWWYQTITLAPLFYGLFLLILGKRIFQTLQPLRRRLFAIGFSYVLVCFALVLYPPYQLACGLVIAPVMIGIVLSTWKDRTHKIHLKESLVLVVAATIVALLVIITFLFTRSEAISAALNTVYPGHRTVASGGANPLRLFDGLSAWRLQQAGAETMLPVNANQSSASNFILISIFLIPASIIMLVKSRFKHSKDWLLAGVLVSFCVLLVRLFVPVSTFLFEDIRLDSIPHERLLIGLGLANVIFVVFFIKRVQDGELQKINPKWLYAYAFLVLLGTFWALSALQSQWPGFTTHKIVLIALSLLVAGIVLLLLKNKAIIALTLLVAFSLFSTFRVHPLYQGFGILGNNQLSQAIGKIVPNTPGTWTIDGFVELENITNGYGAKSLSGVYGYPQNKLWEPLVAKPEDRLVFNRFAHVFTTMEPVDGSKYPLGAYFDPPAEDAFRVHVDPCKSFAHLRNLHFIISVHPLDQELTCLKKVDSEHFNKTDFSIFEVQNN